jgi:hypothetical protein
MSKFFGLANFIALGFTADFFDVNCDATCLRIDQIDRFFAAARPPFPGR